MSPEQRAKEILNKIVYVTVATVDGNGQPWNTPVLSGYDDELTFYWGSYKESQHSQNINNNDKIFLVVYDSTVGAGFGQAVYIKARARTVNDGSEIDRAHSLLWQRHNHKYWSREKFSNSSVIQICKATPEKIWINDEGRIEDTYIDTRKEIDINSLKLV